MKRILKIILILSAFIIVSQSAFAGFIYQNFEPDNGSPLITTSVGPVIINSVGRTEGVHLGIGAIKTDSPHYWTGFGVESQVSSVVDLKQNNNDRLTFWTLAFPHRNCYIYGCETGKDNTVSVRFFDTNHYSQNGFEVWTTNTAKYDQWTKLWVLFSQLPPDFDLTHVKRVEFKNYWPGKYYFDDIHAVREDRVYQSFEKERRSGSPDSEYGWKWNDVDTVATSASNEPAYEGAHSWKLVAQGNWSGTGIQSQEKRFIDYGNGNLDQTFWNVDLNPDVNDRLTLWVYALPENGLDNNLAVQFYDHNLHSTDDTKVVVWVKEAAHTGAWTRLTVLFKDLPSTLNLRDLNKIQIQHYWPGTFYVDNIKATGPNPIIKEATLSQGTIQWGVVAGASNYRLQESLNGPAGPWVTIYSGTQPSYSTSRLTKTWLRVRWEESFTDHNSLPYASDWSNVVEYNPPAVVLKYKSLQNGNLEFSGISQTGIYEIERADQRTGPWNLIYKGNVPASPIPANLGKWYRIRAVQEANGAVVDSTGWSRSQRANTVGQGFVKAVGTMLKDLDGAGDELILKGINLGNEFVIEDWMTGIGTTDNPVIPDDWSVRDVLTTRFGSAQANALLKTFQDSYLQSYDFDRLLDLGFNVARLPIYYRNLQDDNGNWILNAQGQIDFSAINRIVDALSDRGIYTIIDLHGAPGAQSAEFHTGRKNFNKLFNATTEGETYRTRTVDLWKELAKHFKNNTWVVGYDLLNEPVGALTPQILWDLYDRIYDAIRVIDPDHLIMMEGIWDWNTLPNPSVMNWNNVLYQFHFYYWQHDDDFLAHKAYIDDEIAKALIKQPLYNVPVMIGEFHGYGLKSIWEYYISNFNTQKWSWVLWSYKTQPSPSNWAIYNQTHYDEELPKLRTDSYAALQRKFSKYTTADYHVQNPTVINLLQGQLNNILLNNAQTSSNLVAPQNNLTVSNLPAEFALGGTNFGDTPGTIAFYWAACNDYPPGSIACNNGQAGITFWSNTLIKGYIPPDALDLSRYNIWSVYGGELYPTMIGANDAPILNPVGNKFVNPGQSLSFNVSALDPNGDTLTYSAENLPSGATFIGQTFNWTPQFGQSGIYSVTFRVGDGLMSDEETISITVSNPSLPDLFMSAVSMSVTTLNPGDTFYLSNTVKNQGNASATSFGIDFHLSQDAVYGGNDDIIFAKIRSLNGLASGSQSAQSSLLTVPLTTPVGSYYVCVKADYANTVMENNESNQTLCTSSTMVVSLPDLKLTSVSGPTSIFTGKSMSTNLTILNQGTVMVGTSYIGIYLSPDPIITLQDTRIDSQYVPTLDPNESKSLTATTVIPLSFPAGNYYIGAIADYKNARLESDETNNALAGNVIAITRGADMIMTAVSGPVSASRGSSVPVLNTVKNQGMGNVGSFTIGIYLSTDNVITTSDKRIDSRSVSALTSGELNSKTTTVRIPTSLPSGNYFWGAIADYNDNRIEMDETNNSLVGNAVSIQ